MDLQSNLQSEGDKFKEFYGKNRVQMPLLLAEGRVPLSVAGIMKRRLEVRSPEFGKEYQGNSKQASIAQVCDAWWTNYSDSGDGVLYHPDGRIKVVPDAKFLRELTFKTKLVDGAVILADMYDKIDGSEFTREQVQRDRFGTVWLALAREDNALLGEYRQAVADELKTRRNYEGQNMGVYLSDKPKIVKGRLWCVNSSNDYSNVDGDNNLDNYYLGRLFGVAPEAQSPVTQVKDRVSEVPNIEVAPVSFIVPTKDQIRAVLEDLVNRYDPKKDLLSIDYFMAGIDSLYKQKQ